MLIFAAIFAWLGKHIVRTRTERPIVAQIQVAGGNVSYDYQLRFGFVDRSKSPTGSKLVRAVFGDDIYATVNVVFLSNPTTDDDIEGLHSVRSYQWSDWLSRSTITFRWTASMR